MVTLNRIYTRTGDDGGTMLGNGERCAKTDPRVRAYGSVDELNSALGLALCQPMPETLREPLSRIQNELFDVGSDLCTPHDQAEQRGEKLRGNRLGADRVTALEDCIDSLQKDLAPLSSFILPGGNAAGAWLHLARTVCRRAELEVLELQREAFINRQTVIYLNRLSDLLFVMARWANREGSEVLWRPGASAQKPAP